MAAASVPFTGNEFTLEPIDLGKPQADRLLATQTVGGRYVIGFSQEDDGQLNSNDSRLARVLTYDLGLPEDNS